MNLYFDLYSIFSGFPIVLTVRPLRYLTIIISSETFTQNITKISTHFFDHFFDASLLYYPLKCKIQTLVLFFAHRPYDLFCSNASLTPIISESIPRLAELEYNINHHYESLTTTSPTVTQSGTDFKVTILSSLSTLDL